jgi:hypothetical protein
MLVFFLPPALTLRPVVDNDLWWHLRTGQWVAHHKAVPTTDPFSSYGQGEPWVAYSWLFGLLLYGLHQGLGLWGIYFYRLLMSLAITLAVYRLARREDRYIFACALTGLATCALAPLMQERSWLFTILFFALTLDVVLDLREGKPNSLTWFLPAVYALWANLHIEFVVGLALLSLACVAPVLDRLCGWGQSGDNARAAGSPAWRRLALLTAACALTTLVNPYGINIYRPVLELPTQRSVFYLVEELQSLTFRNPWDWAVLTLAMLAAFSLGRRSKLSLFEVLLLIVGAYLAFRSRREIWLAVLGSVAIVASGRQGRGSVLDPQSDWKLIPLRASVVAGVVAMVTLLAIRARGLSEEYFQDAVAKSFPDKAASFVERQGYPGPMANHFDWGGYLIWRLPCHPVSIDGRCNLHTDERIVRCFESWSGSDWESDPDLAAASLIIGPAHSPLVAELRRDPTLELVYQDPLAVVFVRRTE